MIDWLARWLVGWLVNSVGSVLIVCVSIDLAHSCNTHPHLVCIYIYIHLCDQLHKKLGLLDTQVAITLTHICEKYLCIGPQGAIPQPN